MLSTEQNDLITRTGAGTAVGKLMRCYWQPAARRQASGWAAGRQA